MNIISTNHFAMIIDTCKPTATKTLRFMFQSAIYNTVHVYIRSNFFVFHVNSNY